MGRVSSNMLWERKKRAMVQRNTMQGRIIQCEGQMLRFALKPNPAVVAQGVVPHGDFRHIDWSGAVNALTQNRFTPPVDFKPGDKYMVIGGTASGKKAMYEAIEHILKTGKVKYEPDFRGGKLVGVSIVAGIPES